MSTRRIVVLTPLLFALGLMVAWLLLTLRYAHAQDAGPTIGDAVDGAAHDLGAAATEPRTDSAAFVVPGTPCIDPDGAGPRPCLADPLAEPRAYVDTVASAKKTGWPVLVGVILFALLVLAGKWIPYLRSGHRALYISGGSACVAAGVNAGFLGGDWLAMLFAAGGVALALVQGDRTVAAQMKAQKAGV